MENIATSQTNNNGKTFEESLEELHQSYSYYEPLTSDCGFGNQFDRLLEKEITKSELQITDNINKIANILTDATVSFTAGNGSMVTIMNNIIRAKPISLFADLLLHH